ncbi:MAG: flagellar hook protein FlgE [Selenomonadaceae bacterium]|nr:flagellar hook protein FlgE [Selenomonadaceae bacterium]
MMRSLFSGVSGVKGHQTRMDVIGNNIANVNTTGFKYSRTTFADMFSQTTGSAAGPQSGVQGGINPKQVGLGVGVASIDMITTDGAVQSTGKNTDLCLSGNGLFGVKTGDTIYYTRDGAFEFDSEGNYVLPGTGMYVLGWTTQTTDANGKVTIDTTGTPDKITIPSDSSIGPKATGNISYAGNIAANTDTGSVGATTTSSVVDTQGYSHNVTLTFTKTADNTWTVGATSPDGTVSLSSTSITFDENGEMTADTQITATLNPANGSKDPMDVNYNFNKGSVTQYYSDAGSTAYAATNDGYVAGKLTSVTIDNSGTITGVYANSQRQALGVVTVYQFNNFSGLNKTGNSFYQPSNNSGEPAPGTATALGVTITASALEMSNVDVADQFSDMIITQRGFQSNSKIVTVSDEMLETLINMKR